LRALIEDLRLPVPPADDLLDEIDHPLLAKANEQFTGRRTGHERIRAVKDEVLFKVQRWRGAAWIEEDQPWLVAAGTREEGSPDDFYAALAADAEAARARYNTEHTQPLPTSTFIGHLLPDESDRIRLPCRSRPRDVRRRPHHRACSHRSGQPRSGACPRHRPDRLGSRAAHARPSSDR